MKRTILIAALVVALVFGVVAYSTAATATDSVNLQATVNARITLTAPADHNFGPMDPGATASYSGNVNVRSNAPFTVMRTVAGNSAEIGLLVSGPPAIGNGVAGPVQAKAPAAAGVNFNETYDVNIPWTTDPGTYIATVTYDAVTQ